MTQQQLTEKAGVTRQTIVAIENEKYSPIPELAFRIVKVFNTPLEEIFSFLKPNQRPGIVIFTATGWCKPLKIQNMPARESPLSAAECYRFILSNPNVDVCLTGPSTSQQMQENLSVLAGGPPD